MINRRKRLMETGALTAAPMTEQPALPAPQPKFDIEDVPFEGYLDDDATEDEYLDAEPVEEPVVAPSLVEQNAIDNIIKNEQAQKTPSKQMPFNQVRNAYTKAWNTLSREYGIKCPIWSKVQQNPESAEARLADMELAI